jgi:hypothetical protein
MDQSPPSSEPHHYNVLAGKPDWAKQLSLVRVSQRQAENEIRRRQERKTA